jgi:hypothetical protein
LRPFFFFSFRFRFSVVRAGGSPSACAGVGVVGSVRGVPPPLLDSADNGSDSAHFCRSVAIV